LPRDRSPGRALIITRRTLPSLQMGSVTKGRRLHATNSRRPHFGMCECNHEYVCEYEYEYEYIESMNQACQPPDHGTELVVLRAYPTVLPLKAARLAAPVVAPLSGNATAVGAGR
jgi:hypothetical protein